MAGEELHFEDVSVGDDIGPLERAVTDDQVREFVEIWVGESGPSRFTDQDVARREGLTGPIVPGVMSIAIMAQLLTGWSPTVTLKKLDVVFRQTVPHNVPLQFKGVVTEKRVVDGEPQMECDVFVETEQGMRPLLGKATAALPMRG